MSAITPRWRAKAVVAQSLCRHPVVVRGADRPAERAGVAESRVFDEHERDVRSARGRLHMADQPPIRLRATERLVRHAGERRSANRQHSPVNLVTHVDLPRSVIDRDVELSPSLASTAGPDVRRRIFTPGSGLGTHPPPWSPTSIRRMLGEPFAGSTSPRKLQPGLESPIFFPGDPASDGSGIGSFVPSRPPAHSRSASAVTCLIRPTLRATRHLSHNGLAAPSSADSHGRSPPGPQRPQPLAASHYGWLRRCSPGNQLHTDAGIPPWG